ncbi:hypothetical protein QJS10_CPA07g00925 [Acorus calamus]|uniref:DUF4283 domain-containing protein n=1 Tax=Acorus calamus TaxID=4465 RepID=A0AAV9EFD2_ACOCL|nr:hypothetical protein QJS10_CPA07g00925 [Acorus calamus]
MPPPPKGGSMIFLSLMGKTTSSEAGVNIGSSDPPLPIKTPPTPLMKPIGLSANADRTSVKGKSIQHGESSHQLPGGGKHPQLSRQDHRSKRQIPFPPTKIVTKSRSWAQLFPTTVKSSTNKEPDLHDSEPVVPIAESDLSAMVEHWKYSLMGGGFFVVRFSNEDDMKVVIEGVSG